MSDTTTQTLPKTQDDIDREQMIAGFQMGSVLAKFAALYPDKVDKDEFMQQITLLAAPERYKDLSCDDVKKMVLQKYIEVTSLKIGANTMVGHVTVIIPEIHDKYIPDLIKHWTEKGYNTCHTINEGADGSVKNKIRIEW